MTDGPDPRERLQARRQRLWRELLLGLLPALLMVVLLILVTRPAYDALTRGGTGWTPHVYQGLVQDVLQYRVARLDPAVSPARRRLLREIALSSAGNPRQFVLLREVEAQGPARLARVARALAQDTDAGAAQAVTESLALGSAAAEYSRTLGERYVRALTGLRWALVLAALFSGVVSMLLTTRALLLWRAERRAAEARERRLQEALSLASHELRRPLQALMLASDLLRGAQAPEQRQRLLGMIEDSAAQLASRADLTRLNDLYLDVVLRPEPVDLRDLAAPFASARVQVSAPAQPVVWSVDPARTRQMLENLVENALKYTDGPVEITLEPPRPPVSQGPRLQVRDHGPGMSAEQRARVFVPYERGPQGLKPGQGLGLALVRRYARAHGGDIHITHAPDGGLIMTLSFGTPSAGPIAPPRRRAT
ncbi:sensor histidine kinase [Deinococcus aquaedulcis]|uniref:sensor histidine kinase n=1 Tax=Deinococcus aquaedulcis TaxID=2840455 RepID=UPI001C83684E|nr:HAMP domain-containing sensor histidine kinase [Deinococcus aquaedulcis]